MITRFLPHILFVGLLTLAVVSSQMIGEAAATQRVVIDVGSTKGQAGNPIASGFRAEWANTTPRNLLFPLKPNDVGGPWFWPCEDSVWVWAAATGAKVHMGMEATIPRVVHPPEIEEYGDETQIDKMWMHDNLSKAQLMAIWTDHVQRIVRVGEYLRTRTTPPVQVIYEIWNEPDLTGSWNPRINPNSEIANADPVELFMQVWEAGFRAIRNIVPDAVISGPTLAYNVLGAPDGQGILDRSGVQMPRFLTYCDSANCMPTILGWHDIGNWDYADPDLANEPHVNIVGDTTDVKWNLQGQVDYAYRLLRHNTPEQLSLNQERIPQQFEVNEAMTPPEDVTSGIMVREFALAERARMLGLTLAGRTHWCDQCTPNCSPADISTTSYQKLCGLVDPCYGPQYLQKRPAWWTHKAYADITGTYVKAFSSDSLDAVSGFDPTEHKIRVLAGNYAKASHGNTTVVLRHLDESMIVNEVVQVTVSRMVGGHPYEVSDPAGISNKRELVSGDSCLVEITADHFGPGDALSITVSRIIPGTTIARGE
jgi:hypothetical protein